VIHELARQVTSSESAAINRNPINSHRT